MEGKTGKKNPKNKQQFQQNLNSNIIDFTADNNIAVILNNN